MDLVGRSDIVVYLLLLTVIKVARLLLLMLRLVLWRKTIGDDLVMLR